MRINGEIEGLKNRILEALDALYEVRIPKNNLWTGILIEEISKISSEINREIALYIDRKGHVTDVTIGNNHTVRLSDIEGKRNSTRLSGTRCIHTHPNGNGLLSPADKSSLKLLRLDAMITVGIQDGTVQEIYVGIISCDDPEVVNITGPYTSEKEDFEALHEQIVNADKNLRHLLSDNKKKEERAILVGLQTRDETEVSFQELEELTKTAGATVVGRLMQKRNTRNSKTLIGLGKIEELRMMAQTAEADMVIFDAELTGTQQRNIENATGLKVLSRTSIILDIFAQRARSREGILQVELAQMEYRLPRLTGMGQALSRLGGGIGTRGPGETKLETDRRSIRTRIVYLKEQLLDIRKQRAVLRSDRKKNGIPVVSLVGYTNAGKSTLLNTLCEADVLVEDKLFATLDTTTRKLTLDDGSKVLLTDTVGFIRKLPHILLDAFKSTLEELVLSDLILIIADASDPQVEDHIRIVDEILTELNVITKPTIIVLNKIDKCNGEIPIFLLNSDRKVVEISAVQGNGLTILKQTIKNTLFNNNVRVKLSVPFSDGAIMSFLYDNCKVFDVTYSENATLVDVELDKQQLTRVEFYLTR